MTLGERVIEVAKSYLTLREATGHNDGPLIDRMLEYLGLPHNLSWCLAFCLWCYHQAITPLPFPKIARCATFWQMVQENEVRYKTFDAEDVSWGVVKARPGDVMIFSRDHSPTVKNWDGHAALVVAQLSPRKWRTIEGNTNAAGSREGDGVYLKERSVKNGTLNLEGFVRRRG